MVMRAFLLKLSCEAANSCLQKTIGSQYKVIFPLRTPIFIISPSYRNICSTFLPRYASVTRNEPALEQSAMGNRTKGRPLLNSTQRIRFRARIANECWCRSKTRKLETTRYGTGLDLRTKHAVHAASDYLWTFFGRVM